MTLIFLLDFFSISNSYSRLCVLRRIKSRLVRVTQKVFKNAMSMALKSGVKKKKFLHLDSE